VPLSQVETGTTARIAFITAGHGLTGRLCAMGLVAGEHLCVLQNARHGPVIVALDGCRIVLGRGMAEKILVE
jgi:ferrous iron transport protein A